MIETAQQHQTPGGAGAPLGLLHAALENLAALAGPDADVVLAEVADAELIDMLQALRRLRAVTAAVEARVQVAFDTSQRAAAEQRGVPARDRGKGVADQIALARGVSAHRAANDLALIKGLVRELPQTMQRLADGRIAEASALAVARESVCLMPEDRAVVDARIAARLSERTRLRAAASMTRAEAACVDGESVVARIRRAESDRCVTVRPAPDAMVYLSALMPVKDGIAAYAALERYATTAKATGDPRSRGQIMTDELLARLTGLSEAELVPVEIELVMPAETLLGPLGQPLPGPEHDETPTLVPSTGCAHASGHARSQDAGSGGEDGSGRRDGHVPQRAPDCVAGEVPGRIGDHVIPAELCRQIALIPNDDAKRWIRRVFTDPISGEVRAVDERRRYFTGATRRAITLRDQACRTCGAPIRQIDHVLAHADDGATSLRNGQGLCQRCNLTKTQPGWRSRALSINGQHAVITQTPTGHRYTSTPPPILLAEREPATGAPLPPSVEQRLAAVTPAPAPTIEPATGGPSRTGTRTGLHVSWIRLHRPIRE